MAGESKLKLKTQVQYVRHLVSLYWFAYPITTLICVFLVLAAVGAFYVYFTNRFREEDVLPHYSKDSLS
jgi:ABC-type sugar transport system permease subunit